MSDLRQRSSGNSRASNMNNEYDDYDEKGKNVTLGMSAHGAGLAAKSMIDAAPSQHGLVLKLHIPILYTILPSFIQNVILSWSFLFFLAPSWKQRYLILCGSFLYKFKDQSSNTPKGAPFEIKTISAEKITRNTFPELGSLPPGFESVVSVSTLRRQHYYAVSDDEEAMLWLRSLQECQQESITRNMGHAENVPYPRSWAYFDSLGKGLVKSKERIKERMEQSSLRELEMTNFAETGPLPSGYHG